jgi:hypothetical protein
VKISLVRGWAWAVEHPVLFVFAVALAARFVLALGVYVFHDGALFPDDAYFQRLAREMANGDSARWADYDHAIFRQTATFLLPLTALAWLGSAVLPGQLMVAIAGAGAAALTTAIGLHVLRPRWAIAAGAVMALLPSMVLWSSLTLKDAFVWCVLAGLGVVVCELDGAPARVVMVTAIGVALLLLMDHLRDQTFVVAVWAFAIALVLGGGKQMRERAAIGVAVLVLVPALLGYGVAAASWVDDSIHGVGIRREGNTIGAASALACAKTDSDVSGIVAHLPCGLRAIVLRPYPWERSGSLGLKVAELEALLWYPLLALALYGLTRAWPLRRSLAFPVIASAGSVLVYSSVEGNLGTAFRHRAEATWGVALLAAVAAQALVDRRRRTPAIPSGDERASTLVAEHGA